VGVGGEEMRLGAKEAVTFFASAAICGSKDGSRGAGGDETGLGAGDGEEWSGVKNVGVGGRCGKTGRERVCTGVGKDAGVGLGGGGNRVGNGGEGNGGEYRGGERCRSSSSPMPLSNSTSQRLFAAFLVCLAGRGEGEGAVWDSGGDG
jgi:hypothetical protein